MIEILKGKVVPEKVGEADIFSQVYNPDVLLCLANLSNDEVFTPPEVANQMLDMLPQELFEDPNTKFLDPACKSGVFLREIAKRLIKGLENKIPDLQERIDHICKEQLYGIAITELTSLLSRRSVYCSKYPNGPFSIAHFNNVEGNIRFKNCKHEWVGEKNLWTFEHGEKVRVWRKCKWCGTSEELFGDENRDGLEYHAYEFIHTLQPEEIFKMKFDVIISNPPYQLNDGGNGVSASPIYQKFIEQSMKLNPRYLTMIVPSRYFAGGKGLDSFRRTMLSDDRLVKIVDFINAKDCFPENSISGGVNYFLWDRQHKGNCEFTTVLNGKKDTSMRKLDEFDVFIRYNKAVDVIHKVDYTKGNLIQILTSRNPFGFPTSERGKETPFANSLKIVSSKGIGYVDRSKVQSNEDIVDKYKVLISRITYEHAGEPDKDGTLRVLSRAEILAPGEICTDSYIIAGSFETREEAENLISYLKCKFTRFMILQTLSSINLSKERFQFVPMQVFSKPWSDKELYEMYNLTKEEQDFIEAMMQPMDD